MGLRTGTRRAVVCALATLPTGSLRADVDLEWRPPVQAVAPDAIIELKLLAASGSGLDEVFVVLDVVLTWDPSHLELLGHADPCTLEPCPPDTYLWLLSWFPDDSQIDGLNVDLDDGDALYQVIGQPGAEFLPVAPPQGLWVTSLQFRVLGLGSSEVAIEEQIGKTRTRVASGIFPGIEITGLIGPPAEVIAVECPSPIVMGAGSRYFSVTPQLSATSVALRVTAPPEDERVSCVSAYLQADGTLGETPFFLLPDLWRTQLVTGGEILPETGYVVEADCVEAFPGMRVSPPAQTITWVWGDTDGDADVGFDDVSTILDAVGGTLPEGVELGQVDIAPCTPDGVVNQDDVDAALAALARDPFPCVGPCTEMTLNDLSIFIACMDGPFVPALAECGVFDFDRDGDVDAGDFGTFQRVFAGDSDGPPADGSPHGF